MNAAISRKQIALLASKALGLTDKSGKSPFVDTDDLNVMALYNAGIVEGTTESDGLTYYYPDSSITRAKDRQNTLLFFMFSSFSYCAL